jgi:serine/threonine-protein kinase RsbW
MNHASSVPGPHCLRITAGLNDLVEIRRFVESAALRGGGHPGAIDDMLIAMNEATTNVIEHGYHGGPGVFEVEVEYEGDALIVRVRDQAPVFDPSLAPAPDLTLPLEERPPGGMGVHLMRKLTDELSYRSGSDGWNELILLKRGVRKTVPRTS